MMPGSVEKMSVAPADLANVPPIALQNAFWGFIFAFRDKPWRQADLFYMNGVKPLIFNVFWGLQVPLNGIDWSTDSQ